ncbi:MAG: hypothetical protein AB3X41_04495 [Leptothrix ochracea]|uniref:hypothetical protein n=1 Tax=Leptothrix ochracea TaxID=735331 RepID=UPI0034E2B897
MNLKSKKLSDRLPLGRIVLLAIIIFCILYNISTKFNESLTSARMVIFFLIVFWAAVDRRGFDLIDWRLLLIFLPVPYVFVQFAIVHDFGQLSRFMHLYLYSFVGAALVARYAGRLDVVLWAVLGAVSLQSIILLFSFVSIEYRLWVDSYIVSGGNFGADNIYRAPGFTSDSGSSLSVIQSMGVLSGGFLLWFTKDCRDFSRYCILFLMLLCLTSCVVVGRTGLILSGLFCLIFIRAGLAWREIFIIFLGLIPIVGGSLCYIKDMLPPGFSVDFFLDWAFGFMSGKDVTVGELSSMPIAPLGLETMFGYGLVSVVDGYNPSNHDSGFIQNYYSMGFVVVVLFYALYVYILSRLLKWLPYVVRYSLMGIFFAIEVKEPFLFKYAIMFVLVASYVANDEMHKRSK